jgi:hypothetical protein
MFVPFAPLDTTMDVLNRVNRIHQSALVFVLEKNLNFCYGSCIFWIVSTASINRLSFWVNEEYEICYESIDGCVFETYLVCQKIILTLVHYF